MDSGEGPSGDGSSLLSTSSGVGPGLAGRTKVSLTATGRSLTAKTVIVNVRTALTAPPLSVTVTATVAVPDESGAGAKVRAPALLMAGAWLNVKPPVVPVTLTE